MKKRVMEIAIMPEGEPIYSDYAWTIRITTEGGGEFVKVTGVLHDAGPTIGIEKKEWPALRDAIAEMLELCEEDG